MKLKENHKSIIMAYAMQIQVTIPQCFCNHLGEKQKITISPAPVLSYHKNTFLIVLAEARDINCRIKLAGN